MLNIHGLKTLGKEIEVIRLFREQGACTPDLSVQPAQLHPEWTQFRQVMNRLLALGAIQKGAGNTFYLDESRLMQIRMNRIKWGLVMVLAVSLFVLVWMTRGR